MDDKDKEQDERLARGWLQNIAAQPPEVAKSLTPALGPDEPHTGPSCRFAASADLDEVAKRWLRELVSQAERRPKELHDGKLHTNHGIEPESSHDFLKANTKGIVSRINALLEKQAPDYECKRDGVGVTLKRRKVK